MLGTRCQRGWGTVSKFSQLPSPWLRASAAGEGECGQGAGPGRPCRLPGLLHRKECAMEREKSTMWCYLGQASFQRPCFHFFPKLTFLKQVLLMGFLIKLLFGVSHIHFFKLVCLQTQLRSGILYFRPSGVWKAGGESFRNFLLPQINGGYVGHCLYSGWNSQNCLLLLDHP